MGAATVELGLTGETLRPSSCYRHRLQKNILAFDRKDVVAPRLCQLHRGKRMLIFEVHTG